MDALLSLKQAAELLGYSTSGLRKLVRRNAIRYFQAKPHSPIKFRPEWLDEFIDANSIAPRGQPAPVAPQRQRKTQPRKGAHIYDPSLRNI